VISVFVLVLAAVGTTITYSRQQKQPDKYPVVSEIQHYIYFMLAGYDPASVLIRS
jgi:hypothetical protein